MWVKFSTSFPGLNTRYNEGNITFRGSREECILLFLWTWRYIYVLPAVRLGSSLLCYLSDQRSILHLKTTVFLLYHFLSHIQVGHWYIWSLWKCDFLTSIISYCFFEHLNNFPNLRIHYVKGNSPKWFRAIYQSQVL